MTERRELEAWPGQEWPPSRDAVRTPYVGENGETCWEWNICPDCGKRGAHYQDENGRGGVRCG